MLNSQYLERFNPILNHIKATVENLEAYRLNVQCRISANAEANLAESENISTLAGISEGVLSLFAQLSKLALLQQETTGNAAFTLLKQRTNQAQQESWQAIEARLYAVSEALEINANNCQEKAEQLYQLANQMRALNQDKLATEAQKKAFAGAASSLTPQETQLAQSADQMKAINAAFIAPTSKVNSTQEKEKEWYHVPPVPLSSPFGYQNSMQWAEHTGHPVTLEGALDAFDGLLNTASNIPYIYDSLREQAQRPQDLNAALETLTQLHRTHANFICADFAALRNALEATK